MKRTRTLLTWEEIGAIQKAGGPGIKKLVSHIKLASYFVHSKEVAHKKEIDQLTERLVRLKGKLVWICGHGIGSQCDQEPCPIKLRSNRALAADDKLAKGET